ncbi:MAG: D-alanine--D-alanine ligase [Lachnospiraceae bacterium]|nr:D-alanine--D-alanine ligase [Lachnospiraceae bacterium]
MAMKKTVVVLFGGQSSEHEVSCMSAQTVVEAMDREKYNVILIGITKEGHWLYVPHVNRIADKSWYKSGKRAVISPDAGMHSVLVFSDAESEGSAAVSAILVDVVFPVLHGLYGEDGTVQGLLELAKIPYVGCGVLASAVSMDKLYTKLIVDRLKIRQADYIEVGRHELIGECGETADRVEGVLSYPVFIKPANAGSSRGVSRADNREELIRGLKLAAKHDHKILVEKMIVGREIECAVLGGQEAEVSGIGEILAAAEFYDYDAKYNSAESKTVISPELPEGKAEEIRQDALRIFAAVDGFGLSRVDFFLEEGTNEVVFNEINTMPGFTSISMYPMLWEAQGVTKKELVDQLIGMAPGRLL